MALVVQKFGGTSVADADRIRAVADHIAHTSRHGNQVLAVISAMGRETDELYHLANLVSTTQPGRELDMLVTIGERKSVALVAMALADRGIDAVSFTGSQAGIITDNAHRRAKILEIRPDRLREALAAGRVPVVAGFQGVSAAREITTLGRNASDLTAVALAAALDAELCEIYTDVSGVFTADPRLVPEARRLKELAFEELLEMADTGSKVVAQRAVEYARNNHVKLHVRSSFTWEPGTTITEEYEGMEQAIISGVTHDESEAKITVTQVPDEPGVAGRLFRALAESEVNVDMIVQNVSTEGRTDISFTVPKADLDSALAVARPLLAEVGAADVVADAQIARVSLVGAGMKSHPGIAALMFETLAANGVNIEMISTSSIRISCVVRGETVEKAVRALHSAFELDTEKGFTP
jgi:aspartate kinase